MMVDYAGHIPHDAPRLPTGNTEEGKRTESVFEQMGGTLTGPQRGGRAQAEAITDYVGVAQNNAAAGEEVQVALSQRALETIRLPGVQWSPADLDRCEHGRHSIDSCSDCPGGTSFGNVFLLQGPAVPGRSMRTQDGVTEVRIGTMVHGEPIWVTVRSNDRG